MDLPLAVLAGLSVGFVAFAMPSDLLARAVEASHLPSLLSAAAPPLGAKARIVFAVAAAGGTILAVFLLLRMLGRHSATPRVRPAEQVPDFEAEREPETPRLRRADVHPDAPARRPILATRELGEPVPAPQPVAVPAEPPAPRAELREIEEELELIDRVEPTDAAPVWPEPMASLPEPEPEPEPVPTAAEAEPVAAPAPIEAAHDGSIADLIARLERGLARRLQQKGDVASDPVAEAPQPPAATFPARDQGDDRLRSAIENLQRMAARAG
jgi:hypothetical protein